MPDSQKKQGEPEAEDKVSEFVTPESSLLELFKKQNELLEKQTEAFKDKQALELLAKQNALLEKQTESLQKAMLETNKLMKRLVETGETTAMKTTNLELRDCWKSDEVSSVVRMVEAWINEGAWHLSSAHKDEYAKLVERVGPQCASYGGCMVDNDSRRREALVVWVWHKVVKGNEELHTAGFEMAQQGWLLPWCPSIRGLLKDQLGEERFNKLGMPEMPEDLLAMFDLAEPVNKAFEAIEEVDNAKETDFLFI